MPTIEARLDRLETERGSNAPITFRVIRHQTDGTSTETQIERHATGHPLERSRVIRIHRSYGAKA